MKFQTTGLLMKMYRKIKLLKILLILLILIGVQKAVYAGQQISGDDPIKIKELQIERKKKELLILQKRIAEELKKLQQIKEYIKEKLDEIKRMETDRYMQLANLYASIPPKNAGKIMEELDPKTAAKIMLYMDKKKAGIIWGFIDPKKACQITKEMVRLK